MMNSARTIYLVDSDTSARRGLGNLLTAAGYAVEAFSSTQGFMQIESIGKRSCLILDAELPANAISRLQVELTKKRASLPMILLSSGDPKISLDKAKSVKAAGFFRKPIDGPALLDAIAWAIETHEGKGV